MFIEGASQAFITNIQGERERERVGVDRWSAEDICSWCSSQRSSASENKETLAIWHWLTEVH
ncbi:hypothetical protein L484_005991 [Morus notabilis]|uniref:Uncharacterized protein n=1 Tax=Morus notabilis TaxID=981085 RepID=W9R418_9ROSA|nr:hypothetical protein L484_005991 [Morus notabilis]